MSDNILQSLITGFVAIVLAWIALKQAQLHGDVRKIREDVNGHTKLLIAASKSEATAAGKAAGVEQERSAQRARTKADLSTHAIEPNDKGQH